MPTVAELTARYGSFMLGPRPGHSVCRVCFNLTDGYGRCYRCARGGRALDALTPISYSVAGEPLHHALAGYKRSPRSVADRLGLELAAVLWRHLEAHEACLAGAAAVPGFPLVTTVPSGDPARDERHPLHCLVGQLVRPVRERHRRLLRRADTSVAAHEFSADRYDALSKLRGEAVLLIDDTWTTGASVQSAAAALKRAGAGRVAAIVIGRHLNRGWHDNDRQLRRLPQPFDWGHCARCGLDPEPDHPPVADGTFPHRSRRSEE